jgi:hypothetical protein
MTRKVIAVVLFALAICALSAYTQDVSTPVQGEAPEQAKAKDKIKKQAYLARTAAGCGPNEIQFDTKTDKTQHPQALPDPTKAAIYVFSERFFSAPIVRVGMDGKWMGANRDESYFFFTAEPGEHRLCWDMQKGQETLTAQGAATTFTAEAGKTYFFRTTISDSTGLGANWQFARIDGAAGMFLVSSWPLSSSRLKAQKENKED